MMERTICLAYEPTFPTEAFMVLPNKQVLYLETLTYVSFLSIVRMSRHFLNR